MRTAPLLISMAVGYAVLVFAKREARPLDWIGKIIGWILILVSLAGLICIAASAACRYCPFHRSCDTALACPYYMHRGVACAPLESMPNSGDTGDHEPAARPGKTSPNGKR